MVSAAPRSERLYEASLRQGQVKHAVKTALACCHAAVLSYYFHLPSGQLTPVFAYLLLTIGMPSPGLNWLLALLGVAASAVASALLLVAFQGAPFLYLAVTLLWIFTCLLFSNWFPLPATLSAMVSALGLFVFFEGTVEAALAFFVAYTLNFLIAGFSVVVVNTLLWPFSTQKVFLERLAGVYAHLEDHCRQAARWVLSGESPPASGASEEWAPFRPLRQLLAPELRRGRDTSNPFARMILACRSLNLRLWFFNRAIAPVAPSALPAESRGRLASVLDQFAEHLHALLEGVLHRKPVPPVPANSSSSGDALSSSGDILLAHDLPQIVLRRMTEDLRAMTTFHNALLARLRGRLAGELIAFRPFAIRARLLDVNSVRSGAKLVVIILLLLVEAGLLGFRGARRSPSTPPSLPAPATLAGRTRPI